MEGSFDSVFAPLAGLEPATRGLTRLAISLIEDAIHFSQLSEQGESGAASVKITNLQPYACGIFAIVESRDAARP